MRKLSVSIFILGLGILCSSLIWPVSITVLGTDIPCGPAAFTLSNTSETLTSTGSLDPISSDCRTQAIDQIIEIGVGGTILAVIGAVLFVGNKPSSKGMLAGPGWYHDPNHPTQTRYWDGHRWVDDTVDDSSSFP